MRVAVAGATGLVGRFTVAALTHAGHEVLELSRASGVDLRSRTGLAPHLDGASAVIDVTNTGATTADEVRAFFGTATRNLLEAEAEAGVGHHVLLSIVGMERIGDGNPHYAGKLLQEELVEVGPVPCTIQRATQFHEFAWMVVGWTRQGDRAVVPPLTVQPVAAADVGELLATIAVGPPQARSAPDFAGPQVLQLDDMARRTMEALGDPVQIESSWDGPFGGGMTGDRLLPGPGARIGPTTFEAWLTKLREAST